MATICRVLISLVALLCLLAHPAAAQLREFRISHQWTETDARDRAARIFASEVEKRVPGIKVTVHGNLALGVKPVEQFDALVDGRIEMAIYPLVYASDKVPEFGIGLLPGVPPSADIAGLLKGSDFHDRLQALAEAKGVHIMTWWWVGGGIASLKKEIGGPATMKGLTVRSGEKLFDLMLAKAGANVQFFPSSELTKRMADGSVEIVLSSFESLITFKVYEQARFVTFGGNGIWTGFSPILMSRKTWNSLTKAEQQAFVEAAEVSNAYFENTQREALKMAIDTFVKAGAKARELTFEEYSAWLGTAKETSWRTYEQTSPVADALMRSILESFIRSDARGQDGKKPAP